MIFETKQALKQVKGMVARKQAMAQDELEDALALYLHWHTPAHVTSMTDDDLDNLVQQSVDAVDAVLRAYPPFQENRTLATD